MAQYNISVQVHPEYLAEQSMPERGVYTFAYTVTLTNLGDVGAQVIARHWIIEDSDGRTEVVKGLGLVGHQPFLQPGKSFQYTSGCRLKTPSGMMHGSYFCVAENGERFEAAIPAFLLNTGAGPVLH